MRPEITKLCAKATYELDEVAEAVERIEHMLDEIKHRLGIAQDALWELEELDDKEAA